MNPRLLAEMKCDCWAETLAPSVFLTNGLTAKAAASQRRATSMASSTDNVQGWYRSSTMSPRASNAGSGRPAASSGAVKRAMESAASTVACRAAREKSEVDA